LFGGNGGLPKFIIGNPKYLEGSGGLGGPSGHGGFEPPPLGSNGCSTKIMSTFLGIYVCTFTSCFGAWGLDLKPTIVWASVVTNGVLITITID